MATPLRQRLVWALNYIPPGTQTGLLSSVQTLGSRTALSLTFSRLSSKLWAGANLPLYTAEAVHEIVVEEYRFLGTMSYELATYTPADWVRLFETRFSLSVEASSAALPTADWLTSLTAGARSFRGCRKLGLVFCR